MSTTPSASSEGTATIDNLIAGDAPVRSEDFTVVTGQNLARGAVVGRITAGTVPSTGTAVGGNTGNGTLTSVAAGGTDLQDGLYRVRNIKVVTNAGDFQVVAPDGEVVGIATVGVAFVSDHLNFTINDGSTDFALGDSFTITVTGSLKVALSLAAATDGSQVPIGIMALATDATSADKVGPVYLAGDFNTRSLVLGSGHTLATVRDAFRGTPIFLRTSVAA